MEKFQFEHKTSTGVLKFGPVFNLTFLEEVLQLQKNIENIGKDESNSLEKHCFAPMIYAGTQPTISQCVVQSVLGYFHNSLEELRKTDEIDGFTENYLNKLNKCFRFVKKEHFQ